MKKIEFETFWSGILGIIAVIATIAELVLSGAEPVTVAAAIKDISGTLAVIMVLFVAIRQIVQKEPQNFDEVFDARMEAVANKYAPLVKKQEEGRHRYFMASKLSAINDNTPGAYHKLFDFNKPTELEVSISKTVFVGVGGDDELFREVKARIVSVIDKKCGLFEIVEKCESSTAGAKLFFREPLSAAAHAEELADIIDCILLTFVAEYKRDNKSKRENGK